MHRALPLVSLLALTACASLESTEEPSTSALAEQELTTSAWSNVSPGVWQRTIDGRVQRRSVGIDGLRSVLARARAEHNQLADAAARGSTSASAQLVKNRSLLADLEKALAAMEKSPQAKTPAPSFDPDSPHIAAAACGGNYTLNVQTIIVSFVDFEVDASAVWSEFGPFAPPQKRLGTYTTATGAGPTQTDSDAIGPFSGTCCASVSSRSGAYVTFSPQLYGLAYVHITNGCNHFDSLEGP